MQVTEIRINKINSTSNAKAIASITLDNEFVVHNIRVVEHNGNTFISFPSRRDATGTYIDIAHPINSACREKIQNAVLEAYKTAE